MNLVEETTKHVTKAMQGVGLEMIELNVDGERFQDVRKITASSRFSAIGQRLPSVHQASESTIEQMADHFEKLNLESPFFIPSCFTSLPEHARNNLEMQIHALERCEDICIVSLFGRLPEYARQDSDVQHRALEKCFKGLLPELLSVFPEVSRRHRRIILNSLCSCKHCALEDIDMNVLAPLPEET